MTYINTFNSHFKHYQNIFRNQMKNTNKINQITHEDFGLFETEKLSVDYITLNLKNGKDNIT